MATANPGMGVMIRQLFGDGSASVEAFKKGIGQTISGLKLGEDDALHFEFENGYKMKIADEGQSCCESRYMRTDDNLSDFIGAVLRSAEVRDAPDVEDEHEAHEVQFLAVTTSKGVFTMSSHNEHNGYYGGFSVEASEE